MLSAHRPVRAFHTHTPVSATWFKQSNRPAANVRQMAAPWNAAVPRRDVVCTLRAVGSAWRAAAQEKQRGNMIRLLEELERCVPSATEIRWAGLDTAILPKHAADILRTPELIRGKLLRQKWRENFLKLPKHARQLAEPTSSDSAFLDNVDKLATWLTGIDGIDRDKEITVPVAVAFVRNGFVAWQDLDCASKEQRCSSRIRTIRGHGSPSHSGSSRLPREGKPGSGYPKSPGAAYKRTRRRPSPG